MYKKLAQRFGTRDPSPRHAEEHTAASGQGGPKTDTEVPAVTWAVPTLSVTEQQMHDVYQYVQDFHGVLSIINIMSGQSGVGKEWVYLKVKAAVVQRLYM